MVQSRRYPKWIVWYQVFVHIVVGRFGETGAKGNFMTRSACFRMMNQRWAMDWDAGRCWKGLMGGRRGVMYRGARTYIWLELQRVSDMLRKGEVKCIESPENRCFVNTMGTTRYLRNMQTYPTFWKKAVDRGGCREQTALDFFERRGLWWFNELSLQTHRTSDENFACKMVLESKTQTQLEKWSVLQR